MIRGRPQVREVLACADEPDAAAQFDDNLEKLLEADSRALGAGARGRRAHSERPSIRTAAAGWRNLAGCTIAVEPRISFIFVCMRAMTRFFMKRAVPVV
jgi:hypothetical protein